MELVAERVEVVPEHVMVERGAAVEDQQRQAVAAALDHVQAGVGDLDMAPHPPDSSRVSLSSTRARTSADARAARTRNTAATASASAISTPSGHSGLPLSAAAAGRGSGAGAAPIRPAAGNACFAGGDAS